MTQPAQKRNGTRPTVSASDAATPETLARVLNSIFLQLQTRLDELGGAIYVLPTITFDTAKAAPSPTVAPFSAASGGLRITCPFSPTGLVLLRLTRVRPSGQPVSTLPSDVKWRYAAGPGGSAGEGVLHIDFVTGLAADCGYEMIVGVTRAQ